MLPAFFAAFFFALSATCANRSMRVFGAARANLGRLIVAVIVLGAFSHTIGQGFSSESTGWFLVSGIIGMGLGDLALYAALPFLGSRLTVLMTQCLAAPIAALGEWLWLGTTLTVSQMTWGLVILIGVAIALLPSRANPPRVRVKSIGFLFGFLAACGQGFGALVSRKGVQVAQAAGEAVNNPIFGVNAAYHRIIAGLVFTALWFLVLRGLGLLSTATELTSPADRRRSRWWIFANGLAGPVIGVGCYQWALATAPSGVVLPIASITPLLAIPIAYWLEHDRPTRRSIVGAVIAVIGCIALARAN